MSENKLEEELRADVRQHIEAYAERAEKYGAPDGVENYEAWAAHVITSEANKHRRDGL